MRGIIVISHSILCEGFIKAVSMIAGEVSNIESVCLLPEEGQEEFLIKLNTTYNNLVKKGFEEFIVFSDLMGGSPSNASLVNFINNNKVSLISGVNFPMLLTAVLQNDIDIQSLIETGKNGIVDLKTVPLNKIEDEEE